MSCREFSFALPAIALVITLAGWRAAATGYDAQGVAAAVTARTSAVEAVMAAERQTQGRAFEVEFDKHAFHVQVITGDGRLSQVVIDPASGKVQRIDPESILSRVFDADDHSEAAKLALAKLSLAEAMTTAQQETGGKAIEAGFEADGGKLLYEVTVANGAKDRDVTVDAATGKLLAPASERAD